VAPIFAPSLLVAVALAFATQACVVKPLVIPTPSMATTVMPGDTVHLYDGRSHVDGRRPSSQGFLRRVDGVLERTTAGFDVLQPWSLARPFKVPVGMSFVMGDNRQNSADSCCRRLVVREQVIGRGFAVYWPPTHLPGLKATSRRI